MTLYHSTKLRTLRLGIAVLVCAVLSMSLLFLMGGSTYAGFSTLEWFNSVDPEFVSVDFDASIPVSDTSIYQASPRIVYFDSKLAGVLTVSLSISGTPTMFLTSAPAFGEIKQAQSYAGSELPWQSNITYTIGNDDVSQPNVVYTVTNNYGTQASIGITYTRDIIAPEVTMALDSNTYISETLEITGTAQDNPGGSGVKVVEVMTDVVSPIWQHAKGKNDWSITTMWPDYIDGEVYTVTARSVDFLGAESIKVQQKVIVDNVPPVATTSLITPSLPINQDVFTNTLIVQWFGFTDGSGINRYQYLLNHAETMSLPLPQGKLTTTTRITETLGAGEWYLHLAAEDPTGNWSSTITHGPWLIVQQPLDQTLYLPKLTKEYRHPTTWIQTQATRGQRIRTPFACKEKDIWYAGSSEGGVWQSDMNIAKWKNLVNLGPDAYPVVINSGDCYQVYVSVWGQGIYEADVRDPDSINPTPINDGLDELFVYGLTQKESRLYAGTSTKGVYISDLNSMTAWRQVSALGDIRIRSLFHDDQYVFAGSRNCTFYQSTDDVNWDSEVVIADAECEDAQVWAILRMDSALFAGLGGDKGLYMKSENSEWERVAQIPETTIWGLALDSNGYLYVSASTDGIYRCQARDGSSGLSCSAYNEGFGEEDTKIREIGLQDNLLVAGSDDGIWYRVLSP